MSEPATALSGATYEGYVAIREAGPQGMISLRADFSATQVQAALKAAVGIGLPASRQIETSGQYAVGWMSPDELLILCPYPEAPALSAKLAGDLSGLHHLATDMSDARVMFRVEGDHAREVLAKLTPADIAPGHFEPGELRRTRLAQVPAAFWMDETGFNVIAFRSMAQYVFDLLKTSAQPGGEIGLWS